MTLSLTITTTARSACLRVVGDLDYLTVDEVVDTATRLLGEQVDLANLHLDFDGLTFLDSAALSGLLLIYRRTSQAGVRLHLDHRPPILERVLHVTGLFGHFVLSHSDAQTDVSARLGHATSGETGVR
ncbi:STAS domain-containing protein [Mycobacterium sp.]|jgi:anti-anti-sigma factor|uniref:STAS domain-containing protein n=1 Tax=Mycobacterium sp. TaxID=1785 RepID=UPI003F98976A